MGLPAPFTPDPQARLTLPSGRTLRLTRLVRDPTYLNAGEAAPDLEVVGDQMRSASRHAATCFPGSGPAGGPLVAPPHLVKGPWCHFPTDVGFLPRWVSCGLFESPEPTRKGDGDYSRLILVWYQDDLEPILSEDLQAWLQTLDWDQHAKNLEY